MSQKVNWDYLKQLKDPYLFLKAYFIKNNKSSKSNKILIVDPCLIGDFIVSLPAINTFIKSNKNSEIDLIVTPPLKNLAGRIKGIRKVFVAKSSTSRSIEKTDSKTEISEKYDKIVIMRLSDESFNLIKNLNCNEISVPLSKYLKYQIVYPIRDTILKRQPIQRREIDFEILKQKPREVSFEEIFNFNEKDYQKIKKLEAMKTKDKIIIIHTGPAWIMRVWENNKWAELIKKINTLGKFRFVFVGTEEADKDFKEISKNLDFKVYSLIGKLDIENLMLVLRKSYYLIGVDSGPRNMAHLADLRSITLFGPAASGAIYMPWDKKDIVIDKSNGGGLYQAFFYKKKKFIDKITADEVYKSFKRLMKQSRD